MAFPTKAELADEDTGVSQLIQLLNNVVDELKKPARLGPVKTHEAFIMALGT